MSFPRLTSIKFLAADLKDPLVSADVNHTDNNILPSLNLSQFTRLKIFGDSNLSPITKDDQIAISCTTTSLQEVHITSSTSFTTKALSALVSVSRTSLKLLEYKLFSDSGFTHPSSVESHPQIHICALLSSSPKHEDLAITLPIACLELFSDHSVAWHETVRLRIAGRGVGRSPTADGNIAECSKLLESARKLPAKKRQVFGVEISMGKFLFDTKTRLVHWNYKVPRLLARWSGDPWSMSRSRDRTAPGLYGGSDVKGEWSAISEEEFWEGMGWGFIKFDG